MLKKAGQWDTLEQMILSYIYKLMFCDFPLDCVCHMIIFKYIKFVKSIYTIYLTWKSIRDHEFHIIEI